MIGFGFRLAVAGGREAVTRLVTVAAAVALGVGLLLATLAGMNAVNAQMDRYAWLNPDTPQASASTAGSGTGASSADPVWWQLRLDAYAGTEINRVDVAATGPHSPVPPGIPHLPGPGEYYASPALTALFASTPADQLADRYPGRQVGTIGEAALPAPNSLVIVVGHTPDELSHLPQAKEVTGIATSGRGNRTAAALDLILAVVAAGLLFPVLIFIGTATRLAATRREQRFAAMRLVGATPRQISVISAVESTAAALAGTAVGFGLFYVFRDPLAGVPFTGLPFFPGDMSLNLVDALLVGLGIPTAAALAARIALRRVRISPLGVTRRVTPRPPRVYRLIPLLAGIAELAYFVGRRPATSNGQVAAYLPGLLLIMAGLIVAGPWLTMVGARTMARRSSRPATLIAARRLADNPRAGFRAVSGLVIGLFVTSVAVGVITTIVADRGVPISSVARQSVAKEFWPDNDPTTVMSIPDALSASLKSIAGAREVTVVRRNPGGVESPNGRYGPLPGLVSCADLSRVPGYGRCPAGATVASVYPNFTSSEPVTPETVWPAGTLSPDGLSRLPIQAIVVRTDGSTTAIERVRTALEVAFPVDRIAAAREGDYQSAFTQVLAGWQQLANVVILTSLAIAGCSLAVSVAGGLAERKRPFSLLRLAGVPLRVLRRVVALESAVPLILVALFAIGMGFLAAQLFLRSQMHYTLRPPGLGYYLVVLAGLATSLGIIAATLPLLRRITGPETARNE